jgi:hypothetical protein
MLRFPLVSRSLVQRKVVTNSSSYCFSALRFGGGHGDEKAIGSITDVHGRIDTADSSHPENFHVSIINEVSLEGRKEAFVHQRSSFQYEGSLKADEVGARNEAAFIPYTPTHPSPVSNPTAAFAMPNIVNLLTVAPMSVALSFAAAFFWGVALWRVYANKHFRAIVIERPLNL